MSKAKLSLFTLLTSVRLESGPSGVKEERLYHIGEEVKLFPVYGGGLVDNLMAVEGKVEAPKVPEITNQSVKGLISQKDAEALVAEETAKNAAIQGELDESISELASVREELAIAEEAIKGLEASKIADAEKIKEQADLLDSASSPDSSSNETQSS